MSIALTKRFNVLRNISRYQSSSIQFLEKDACSSKILILRRNSKSTSKSGLIRDERLSIASTAAPNRPTSAVAARFRHKQGQGIGQPIKPGHSVKAATESQFHGKHLIDIAYSV